MPDVSDPPASPRAQYVVLALLVASVCLNYVARSALGIAAPIIGSELHLTPDKIGLVLSSFFWLYAVCQIVAGWLVDRYDVRWVLGLGFLLWSMIAGLTGLAGGFVTLLVLRLLLGVSESAAYPSYGKIIATTFPEDRRGLCNALIEAGNQLGPALATLLGGLVAERFGWRAFFFLIGLASLLWLPAWIAGAPRRVQTGQRESTRGAPGFRDILRLRSAWGSFIGLFAVNYVWIFLVTWLPSYLVMERHFSLGMMAVWGSVPLWGLAAASLLSGWLSDLWIRRGATPTRVRKTFTVCGLLLCTLFLPAVVVQDSRTAMVLLSVATLALGLPSANVFAITQTMAGPRVTGKWTGLQNAVGNLSGIVAPWLTGEIVQTTGSFFLAFLLVCVVAVMGAASFLFVVGRVEPVRWPEQSRHATQTAAVSHGASRCGEEERV